MLLSALFTLLSFVSGWFLPFSYSGSSSPDSTISYEACFAGAFLFLLKALNTSLPDPLSDCSKNFMLKPFLWLNSLSYISYFYILRFVSQWSVTIPLIVSYSSVVASSILNSLIPIALPYGKNSFPNKSCFISSLISSKSLIKIIFIIFYRSSVNKNLSVSCKIVIRMFLKTKYNSLA